MLARGIAFAPPLKRERDDEDYDTFESRLEEQMNKGEPEFSEELAEQQLISELYVVQRYKALYDQMGDTFTSIELLFVDADEQRDRNLYDFDRAMTLDYWSGSLRRYLSHQEMAAVLLQKMLSEFHVLSESRQRIVGTWLWSYAYRPVGEWPWDVAIPVYETKSVMAQLFDEYASATSTVESSWHRASEIVAQHSVMLNTLSQTGKLLA